MSKYDVRKIFADMELDLIKSMQRNLARHEAEEEELGFEWEQWQARKLQNLKQFRKQNKKIVEQRAPEVEKQVTGSIRSAFRNGAKKVADAAGKLWNKFGFGRREDLPRPKMQEDDDENFFKLNKRRVDALTDASKGELRAAQHSMLRQADDVYRQTIFKSQVYLNSGAASLGQAIDMATRDFLDKGFDYVTYSNGRRINVASYAEMALRTASQRAVFSGEGAKRNELGIRTVVISAHNNCSKLCLPYQGKVFIDDVYSGGSAKDGDYPLLSKAMAGGLFHPNCRHNMATYIPGVSKLPAPVDDEVATANYQAEQRQRYMERQIRKYKRREAGAVDPANKDAAAAKVKQWQAEIRQHIANNDHLRRDRAREN
ncbi:Phage minor capsid protein 2 [Paenibacillus algorifonticola]|uniref:Phage minor capsid protein 2 n=1 Tax=Paenibacillus algorifonticola TaxID=684063 RepID=A0A1I1XVL4_9BACL|nr:phage minor capsid protein [Paenibacillus algorifonticola]SFE11301.1 Phage minor capsid protein 2 [Paenibacillus algorifonticola]